LVAIIDVQKHEAIASKVNVKSVIDTVEKEFTNELYKHGANMTITGDPKMEINFVQAFLQSVCTNLVSNAIKYRSPERPLYIGIEYSRKPDGVLLVVKDNGMGMDLTKTQDTLFKPFTRFHTNTEGRGVGLHIIMSMIEKNGGYIEVSSKLGEGSTFTCLLKEYESEENNMVQFRSKMTV
jgi:light-regulated signal transduction histidine kinase (bacteriophytochrome)